MSTRRRTGPPPLTKPPTWRGRTLTILDGAMEGLVYLLIVSSPWIVGGNLPIYSFAASIVLGLLLLLWTVRQLVSWNLTLHRCPVSVALVALFVVSAVMLVAVPRTVIENVSPEAARLYNRLLPATPETLAEGGAVEELPFRPGSTLSVYPGATQTRLLDLLAVLVLFVVVRHALASPDRLRRLAYVLVINGGALAVFGLWQKVRSPANTVYGLTVEGAQTFGPFINRNHFAMYVNCCICLGLGLFLSRLRRARGEYAAEQKRSRFEPTEYVTNPFGEILQHPSAVWVLIPIAVALTAVLASLSRGGILALAVGMVAGFFALRRRGLSALIPVIVIPLVALGILTWYGLEPTLQRLDQQHLATEGRFPIWRACWDAFVRFPAVGTGLGTFQYVEPVYRPATAIQSVTHLHAHNEYLEALVEGGVVRFVLTLVLVALVLLYGWRACKRLPRESDQLLAAGAWAACVTVAIHSLGEFGVHMTSIAALVAVLAAFVTALGISTQSREEDGTLIKYHYFGIGPILGAIVAVTVGLALVSGAWRETQSEFSRTTGLILRSQAAGDPAKLQAAVEEMDAAIGFAPSHYRVRMERFEIEEQRLRTLAATNIAYLNRTTPVLLSARSAIALAVPGSPLRSLADLLVAPVAEQAGLAQWYQDIQRKAWREQARHLLAARNLCPIAGKPHLEIAQHVATRKTVLSPENRFYYWASADPHELYLDRVKLLLPNQAETWYLCGAQEGTNGQRADAIASWRRSLELSDQFLEPIVNQAARDSEGSILQPDLKLTTQEMLQDLLPPESARSLVKTAWALYPRIIQVNERRPYLDKAIGLLEKDPAALEPENQYLYGLALWGLNKREQAAQHIRDALTKAAVKPAAWRLDLARLYLELQRFAEARDQVSILLRESPSNPEVLALQEKLDKAQRPAE